MSIAQIELLTRNRQPHETQAGVRYKTLDAAVAEFTSLMDRLAHAEDRAAACTCQLVKGFEIDTRRDRPLHAMFIARRLERMRVEEAG
jgi:hypothetical protein